MAFLLERNIKTAGKTAIKLILGVSQFITFLCVRLLVGSGGRRDFNKDSLKQYSTHLMFCRSWQKEAATVYPNSGFRRYSDLFTWDEANKIPPVTLGPKPVERKIKQQTTMDFNL